MKSRRILIIAFASLFLSTMVCRLWPDMSLEMTAARKTNPSKKSEKGKTSPNSSAKTAAGKKSSKSGISVIYTDTATGEWIHRGNAGIIIHRDAEGTVRAMSPFRVSPSVGEPYALALNEYAERLKDKGVQLYSLIAPTQGEFYMPPQVEENRSQAEVIEAVAEYFSDDVTPIFVAEALRAHRDEDIYNRTDHHWAPLGAFYAAEKLAKQLHRPFTPLNKYRPDTVRDYVGTMYKFSGDPAVKNSPEDFIAFITPGDYYAESIDYKVSNNETVSESEKHPSQVFRKFKDGSGAAYSTFLGGDHFTVRIVNRNGDSGRKILIVKDSFGNALAPCLINSFDEVHVVDFRYFPHNLLDYIDDNGITDLVFVNCPSLAFSKNATKRFHHMMNVKDKRRATEQDQPEDFYEDYDDNDN